MKILKNNVDREAQFTDLGEAKKWYMPDLSVPDADEIYVSVEEYMKSIQGYADEIQQADSLEELAGVLNAYTDRFEDGRWHEVVEI